MCQHENLTKTFVGKKPSLSMCGLFTMDIDSPSLGSNLSPVCGPPATESRRYSKSNNFLLKLKFSISYGRRSYLPLLMNDIKRMVVDYSQTINHCTKLDAYPLPTNEDQPDKIDNSNLERWLKEVCF